MCTNLCPVDLMCSVPPFSPLLAVYLQSATTAAELKEILPYIQQLKANEKGTRKESHTDCNNVILLARSVILHVWLVGQT